MPLYQKRLAIVNDITNFCFRPLPKPYAEAFAGPEAELVVLASCIYKCGLGGKL